MLALQRALDLRPEPHLDQYLRLTALGSALYLLSACNGDINALNKSISYHDAALALFTLNGDINVLDEGIVMCLPSCQHSIKIGVCRSATLVGLSILSTSTLVTSIP